MTKSVVDQVVSSDLLSLLNSSMDYIPTQKEIFLYAQLNETVRLLRSMPQEEALYIIEELTRTGKLKVSQYVQLRGVVLRPTIDFVFIETNKN